MRLRELMLSEEAHVLEEVSSLNQLKGGDGQYLGGTVNVAKYVNLTKKGLKRLPVQFGTVGSEFLCGKNLLTSLEGAPTAVGGSFYCHENQLTLLEGAPAAVDGSFYCYTNLLTSLVGVHRILKRISGTLYLLDNPIKTGGIGLVLVEGLTRINADQPAFEIINGFLGQGKKGLLRCQEALHEAGLEKFAMI